jgi:hypothetical protein
MAAKKSGPKPETLQIESNWKDAAAHAMKRGKPPAEAPPKPKAKGKKKL